jgi:undecaprenyl-diphosphatase
LRRRDDVSMTIGSFSVPADARAERWVVDHRVAWLDHVFVWLTRAGTWGLLWLVAALVLAVLLRRPPLFVLVAAADLVAGLLAEGLKDVVGRPRPHVSHLVAVPRTASFPSGHASTSFACAAVLAALVPPLRLPALVVAAAVAYSRLYVGVHYPLDVLAGALLGVATARLLLGAARRRSRPGRRSG